jgi:beta-N-acetylhexosaminidase
MTIKPFRIEMELDPELIAGQMVVSGFEGKTLPSKVGQALSKGHLSGVILFERNLGTPLEIRELTDSIRDACVIPPVISIDQEGGRVLRLKEPFTKWPSMGEVGENFNRKQVFELARKMSAELLAVGINTDYAPVLDVDSNPENPVIGDRSFGPDPQRVARLGAEMIQAFLESGIISCGKHFPGHGDTEIDSHIDLPAINVDKETLYRRELVPFTEAIKAKVPMIMTAHMKATALDPYYPATISRPILQELLRMELGFEGVVITDDLEMGALSKHMPIQDAAFSSIRAGADMVMVCSGHEKAQEVRNVIVEGINQGIIDFGNVAMSTRRILAMKEQYLLDQKLPGKSAIESIIGCEEHKKIARMGHDNET